MQPIEILDLCWVESNPNSFFAHCNLPYTFKEHYCTLVSCTLTRPLGLTQFVHNPIGISSSLGCGRYSGPSKWGMSATNQFYLFFGNFMYSSALHKTWKLADVAVFMLWQTQLLLHAEYKPRDNSQGLTKVKHQKVKILKKWKFWARQT